jgi:hypothetical protein
VHAEGCPITQTGAFRLPIGTSASLMVGRFHMLSR